MSHLDPCNLSFLTCLKFKLTFYSNLCSRFPVVIHVQVWGRKLCAHFHLSFTCVTCPANLILLELTVLKLLAEEYKLWSFQLLNFSPCDCSKSFRVSRRCRQHQRTLQPWRRKQCTRWNLRGPSTTLHGLTFWKFNTLLYPHLSQWPQIIVR